MFTADNLLLAWRIIPIEFLHTIYMVVVAHVCAFVIALPLAVVLFLTNRDGLVPNRYIYPILSALVDLGRSIPFAILVIALFPVTRWVLGTSVGTNASIVPLFVTAAPFFARIIESAFKDIDPLVIETAIVTGSSISQVIRKICIPEALPEIINGASLTMVNLVGHSGLVGLVGGGGLGKVAIQYGYQRFNLFFMLLTLFLMVLIVVVTQGIGLRITRAVHTKRGKL